VVTGILGLGRRLTGRASWRWALAFGLLALVFLGGLNLVAVVNFRPGPRRRVAGFTFLG